MSNLLLRYKAWRARTYVPLMCLPAFLYACSCALFAFFTRSHTATVYLCIPPTAVYQASQVYWVVSNLCTCFLVIIIYSAALIAAHMSGKVFVLSLSILLPFAGFGHGSTQSQNAKRALLQSLVCVTLVYTGTWFITVGLIGLVSVPSLGEFTADLLLSRVTCAFPQASQPTRDSAWKLMLAISSSSTPARMRTSTRGAARSIGERSRR